MNQTKIKSLKLHLAAIRNILTEMGVATPPSVTQALVDVDSLADIAGDMYKRQQELRLEKLKANLDKKMVLVEKLKCRATT